MNNLLLLLRVLACISFSLSFYHDNVPCTPVDFCKCDFPNGLGIDLNLLSSSDLNVTIAPNEYLIFYPCTNKQVPSVANATLVNECEAGASLCLQFETNKTFSYYNLGLLGESNIVWKRINDNPALIFDHNYKITQILLECDHNAKAPKLVQTVPHNSQFNYDFTLTTDLACVTTVEDEGRSVFSTFFIVLIFLFLVYLVVGFLVLRFIRGARGWEAVPNGDFWRSGINGIRKMFIYIGNGCKTPETYDTI